jgi:hypothetical protein
MRKGSLVAAVLLILTGAEAALGEPPGESVPPPLTIGVSAPPPGAKAPTKDAPCWDWLCGEACNPVTAGDPELNDDLWQQTWGIAGLDAYPVGRKMAPNGFAYDPLFSLDLLLNIALTRDRSVYLFTLSRFWAQKAADGFTNNKQGPLDFSKRQFDLDAGFAWNFYGRLEARAYYYSDNNLNRGNDFQHPVGYKDGFALECRYYLASTDFDRGLYRYLSLGCYPTKEMVGADGQPFKPGFFAAANLAYDILPERYYVYANVEYIARDGVTPKLVLADAGIALRPFDWLGNLEFRVGADSTIDVDLAWTRTLFYGNVRIVW